MSHYAKSVFYPKLRKKHFIQKRYLNAHVFGSTNAKELEKKGFFDLLVNCNRPIDILFTLIPNFDIWYFILLK